MDSLPLRDRSQDNTKAGFEKREKRRRIRKLQDAITQNDIELVKELLQDNFDVDFQYRGQTALQQAVKAGNYDICKILIDAGADVNKADAELNNLLNAACWRGYGEIAKLLIDSNADLDARNDLGCTSLNTCAFKGYADIAEMLLLAKCDPDTSNSRQQTPLFTASYHGHVAVVNCLIAAGCEKDVGDDERKTALMIAAKLGYVDVVKALIRGGANLNKQDKLGCTAVYHASTEGHIDIITELVRAKADVNIPVIKGPSPLLDAISNGFIDVALLLINSGANVDQTDRLKQAPIHAAVRHVSQVFGPETEKSLQVVQKLVNSGCNINASDNQGWTPLYQSAFAGNKEVTKLLLDNKADVTIKTNTDDTVLHAAASGNCTAVVDMLISAGSEVNVGNNHEEYPLYTAVVCRADIEILKVLVRTGTDLEHREKTKQYAVLHEAIVQHYTKAATLLIDSGCDINVKNGRFQTPLYLACEKGNDIIVQRLISDPKCLLNGTRPSTVPLHAAVVNNHIAIARQLIEAGCNIDQINDNGLTPVMTAAKENNPRLVKLLLMHGCDLDAHAKVKRLMKCCLLHPDAHPHFDLQPLFLALTHSHLEMMKWFMKCHGNIPYSVITDLSEIFLTSQEIQAQFSQKMRKEVKTLFQQALESPRSLQDICRVLIREHLGSKPHKKIDYLPIAKKLKDFILMLDLFGTFEELDKECSSDTYIQTGLCHSFHSVGRFSDT